MIRHRPVTRWIALFALSLLFWAGAGRAALSADLAQGPVAAGGAVPSASAGGEIRSPEVRIGVLDTIDPWFYVQMFAPTMEHLRRAIPGVTFKTEQISAEDLASRGAEGAPLVLYDFLIVPSGFFASISETLGANHLATRHRLQQPDPAHSVGSVFIVREGSSARTLMDLKGKTVAATDPESFSGWVIALGEIHRLGEDEAKFFGGELFTGYGLPDVASLVLNGEADAGILPTCDLERLEATGSVPPGSLRVLNEKPESAACRASTDLYPDVVFVALPAAPSGLVKDVTVALLAMPQTLSGEAWGFASNFAHVRQLYKDLEMGPYSYLKETSPSGLLFAYRYWIAGVAGVLLLILSYAALVRHMVTVRTKALRVALNEAKRAQERERNAQERLFQLEKTSVVGGLSSLFAHEVRQPIASIVNYAGGLKMYLKGKTKDPLVEEAVTEIEEQAERICGIVDRVRSYAKSEERVRQCVDLNVVIGRSLEIFGKSRLAQGVEVQWRAGQAALCEADPLEIELVFVNLLRNAAAAMASDKGSKTKTIGIGLEGAGGFLRVRVRDNGPAVTEEKLAALEASTQRSTSGGLGLGLTICRVIVEGHGGHLHFERAAPSGLAVEVTLPRLNEERSDHGN